VGVPLLLALIPGCEGASVRHCAILLRIALREASMRLLWVFVLCVAASGASAQGESETEPAAPPPPAVEATAEESKAPAAQEAAKQVREAVEAGNYFFMKHFEARDAQAIADLYSEAARVIAPGAEPAEGRAAIAAFWAAVMEGAKSARLETLAVEAQGELAVEDGVARLVANDGSESVARYLVVWKRVGRRWQLHRDIWNSGPVAAATEATPSPAAEPSPAPVFPEPPL
jgi:ketosteroid isomerase-like protein